MEVRAQDDGDDGGCRTRKGNAKQDVDFSATSTFYARQNSISAKSWVVVVQTIIFACHAYLDAKVALHNPHSRLDLHLSLCFLHSQHLSTCIMAGHDNLQVELKSRLQNLTQMQRCTFRNHSWSTGIKAPLYIRSYGTSDRHKVSLVVGRPSMYGLEVWESRGFWQINASLIRCKWKELLRIGLEPTQSPLRRMLKRT